ncbi:MAG: hypothetical protein JWM78_2836 [Verrucomicrobiaceae bacterium]|nr:hypothetical protein [Verrucomicrobiaceae bacterium]
MLLLRFDFRRAPFSPVGMADLYAGALEMARWADNTPGASVLFSQHHRSPDGYLPSPLIMASAVAACTQTLPITVGALLLLMYDPVKLAEDMSVLDHLSRGRINYVIGLGYRDAEYAMFGVDPRQRGKQMDEYLGVLRQAFSGDEFSWRERVVQITPAPLTVGGPLCLYGGGTVAAAKRAARLGMLFMPQSSNAEILKAYDDEAIANGHPPGMYQVTPEGCPTTVFVADDIDQGWRDYGPYMLHDAMVYAQWLGADNAETSVYSAAKTVDELRAKGGPYVVVTPTQALDLRAKFGMLALQPLSGGVPPELAWKSLRLIEEKVLPAMKSS